MDDFQRLTDFTNLYQAHLLTRLGKHHKADVIRFETNLGYNLAMLSSMLEENTYLPLKYYHFKVFEPKERDIHALRYPDRVVQRCLCDQVLLPIIEPRLIFDNAACRKGKGTHFSINRLSGFLREHYVQHGLNGYVLKCDIRKYFQNIDHGVLKHLLFKLPFSDRMCDFLSGMIDSFEFSPGIGLPLGNQSSQWFALYYLDKVDRLIKEQLRIKHYVRYMDDFLLLHSDKAYLKETRLQIESLLSDQLKLELNEKTQIAPVRCGVRYLGFDFRLGENGKVVRRLLLATKKRVKHSVATLEENLDKGRISQEFAVQVIASYRGHLRHGHCQGLDRYLQQVQSRLMCWPTNSFTYTLL